jgi:hypothetical protein
VPLPLLLYQGGRGYKEGNRVDYNMIQIRIFSLLAYFTYILIDTIIYALGSTSWSSGIIWMVGRVVKDPSLGLPSPGDVVPRVLILAKLLEHFIYNLLVCDVLYIITSIMAPRNDPG